MPNPLIGIGASPNDHTGDQLRVAFQKINQLPNWDAVINAGSGDYVGTREQKITTAAAAAAAQGKALCWVPLSMIPYDPLSVTFQPSVKMVREGGNPLHFDVVAYGGRQADGSISSALRKAVLAAVANGGGIIDIMTSYGSSFITLDVNYAGDLSVYEKSPLTFLWGPSEVRVKVQQTPLSHHHHLFHGTRFVMKDESGNRVTGQYLWISNMFNPSSGFGGVGDGLTTTSGSAIVTKTKPTNPNWNRLEVGSPLSVFGFVPPLATDDSTLNGGIDAVVTTITLVSTTMMMASGFVRIENELVSYTSKNATQLLGCTRGAEGTTAAAHSNGVRVDRIVFQPCVVKSISGNDLTLDTAMDITAANLTAYLGAYDISFDGVGDFDGNQDPTADDTANPQGIYATGVRQLYVGPGITFRNWDHGGWNLSGCCQDCLLYGRGYDNTKPALTLGSAFWVFGWNKRNMVDILEVDGAYEGLAIDDRTNNPTLIDGPSEASSFRLRVARNIGNTGGAGGVGLLLHGCRRCNAEIEYFHQHAGSSSAQAVSFGGATQWANETASGRKPISNVITVGVVDGNGTHAWIIVTAAGDDDNTVIINSRFPFGVVQPNNNLLTVPVQGILSYGTTVNTDAMRCENFVIDATNGVAFTVANPTNPTENRRLTYHIANTSGGAMGAITWGGEFKLSGAFTNPANNQYRMITFRRFTGLWREENRTAADQSV